MRPRELVRAAGNDGLPQARSDANAPSARLPSRRDVLRGLVASGLTVGMVGSLVAACSDDTGSGGSDGPSGTSEAEEAITRIGRRYRQDHPEEDDHEVLLELLGVGVGDVASSDFLPSLDEQATEDYAADRTVQLDGWVLSVTEGRAAALVSLH